MANFGGSTQLLGETQMLREKLAAAEAEVERLRAIIAWAGNEEAVRIAGLPNPSPEEPSHAH